MTDTIHTEHGTEALEGRQLNLALSTLLVEVADDVDQRFKSDGNPASAAHVANYEAHRSAYTALRAVLIALPAEAEYRRQVLAWIERGAQMTGFDPKSDELVRKCIERAADDYKPDTPDELKRSSTPKRAAVQPAAAPKAAGK